MAETKGKNDWQKDDFTVEKIVYKGKVVDKVPEKPKTKPKKK